MLQITQKPVTFRDIMTCYKAQPQAQNHVSITAGGGEGSEHRGKVGAIEGSVLRHSFWYFHVPGLPQRVIERPTTQT